MQKKESQNSVIILCGILFLLMGIFSWKSEVVVFSAEKGAKESGYKAPALLDGEQSFSETWYGKKPKLKLIHSEQRTVTKYRLISASGKNTEGVLEMEETEVPDQPEVPEQQEIPEQPEVSGQPENPGQPETPGQPEVSEIPENPVETPDKEPQPVEKVLNAEVFEEGVNTLQVWMELKEDIEESTAKNNFGNSGKTASKKEVYRREYQVKIDLSVPEKVIFKYGSNEGGETIYSASPVTLEIAATDKISGIREIVYSLGDGEVKKLSGRTGKVILPLGYQGKITAYAVDLAGNSSEKASSRTVMCEDEAPEITLQTKGGFDGWHTEVPEIQVLVKDPEKRYSFSTGVAQVTGYVDGEQVYSRMYGKEGEAEEKNSSFTVEKSSQGGKPVDIMIRVVDNAGNVAVKREKLYIDLQSPQIQSKGIHDQQITAEKLKAEIDIIEENCLQAGKVTVIHTTPEGEKMKVLDQELLAIAEKDYKRMVTFECEKDGTYEVVVTAIDCAGHKSEQKMHVILDQTNPMIKYVNQLEGSYFPYFQWNYGRDEMIIDFTEYTYQMQFDGKSYFPGERKNEEGRHLLQVKAKDAAGNESSAEAVFTIDHTAPKIHWGDLKSGASYEESVMLSVWVDQKDERIAEILINGEKQKLSPNSQMYQYEVIDSGTYHVKVLADDLAGNSRAEQMEFTVTEKEGIVKKVISPVIEPVKKLFLPEMEENSDMEEQSEVVEEGEDKTIKIMGMLFIMVVLGSVGTVIIRKNLYNNK